MTQVDIATLAVLTVVLGALVLLGGVLLDWRGVMSGSSTLPLWGFLARRGRSREAATAEAGQRALRLAEMRCATCSSHTECADRLAAGVDTPVADCPNTALLETLKQRPL
jgi:hypothetical protein